MKFYRCGIHLPVGNLKETLDFYQEFWVFLKNGYGKKGWRDQSDEMRLLFVEDPKYVATVNNNNHRLNLMWFVDNIEEIF